MKTKNYGRLLTLTIAALLVCFTPLIAQDDYSYSTRSSIDDQRRLPHLGIKAGVNISNIYDTKSENLTDTYKIGFAGGVFFSVPLGPVLGIQPEVIYSKKGYKGSGTILAASYRYTRNFDYIDVPILLQVKPSESVTIVGGPVFSWLLNKRFTLRDGTISVENQTALRESNIRKNTFGVTGGLDINLYPVILSGRVGFDLRDNNGDGTSTDPRFKNAWVQATVGLIF
jgi:hypothetical protein